MFFKEAWYRRMILREALDSIYMWIAWHMPKRLVKWCFVRVASYASYIYSSKEMGAITVEDIIEGWKNEKH